MGKLKVHARQINIVSANDIVMVTKNENAKNS